MFYLLSVYQDTSRGRGGIFFYLDKWLPVISQNLNKK